MADPNSWDLLDEDCSDISDWVDNDKGTGVSEVEPAGQFRLDTNLSAAANDYTSRSRDIGSYPDLVTFEIKVYHDSIGTFSDVDRFQFFFYNATERFVVFFCSDGLFIWDTDSGFTEVGTDLVKEGASKEWQTWRFLIDYSGATGDGICDVYLKDLTHTWELVGNDISCSREDTAEVDGHTRFEQMGYATDDMVTHIDYIKMASGLYAPYVGYFSGYVYEQTSPVSREVYLHDRSTGDLVATTTSSGNGYYYVETTLSGSHYIVCLDDAVGVEYNDLIIGSAIPTTVSG